MRIFQYYLPVFFWCWDQVKAQKQSGNKKPVVIGMQAVQGCGKTTLVEQLQELFTHVGLQAASISIDDFYLTHAGQQQLIRVSEGYYSTASLDQEAISKPQNFMAALHYISVLCFMKTCTYREGRACSYNE